MAKTFCNDNDMQNMFGFAISNGVNTADLLDQVAHIDYHVCNKMGTSIPTIFARMFLFQSAYQDIVLLEGGNPGNAHNYVVNPDTGAMYTNVYHHLISEHLDMLEFLFIYGAHIQIQKWKYTDFRGCFDNAADNIYKGLKRLSDAMEAAYNDTPILNGNEGMEVLLFKYKNVFVGGTSPSLIVFTSPNWKQEMLSKGWNFNGLFDDANPRPLHQRSLSFRKLLTLMAMGNMLTIPSLASFRQYIINNKDNGYDKEINTWWDGLIAKYGTAIVADWIPTEIEKIADPMQWDNENQPNIVVSPIEGVQIFKQTINRSFTTQYKIKPTRSEVDWSREVINGGHQILKGAPMLIVPNGIARAKFFDNELWNATTQIPPYSEMCNQYLSQRMVPGKEVMYPIVTADDFLENNIVELAYNIDKEHFFTACGGNINFMLPIKKMFFRFFTFEDLRTNLTISLTRDRDNIIEKVNVKLVIPMENNNVRSYIITRTYTYDESAVYRIISCRRVSDSFNIGIFPFFKSDSKPQLNSYHFMRGETSTKIECRLGKFSDVGFVIPRDGDEGTALNFVNRSTRDRLSTSFAQYNDSFDYIEVNAKIAEDHVTGMFFPLMPVVGNGTDNKWGYSVDFGTSNTHIVMAEKNDAGGIIELNNFGYTNETPQMVTLSTSDSNRFGIFDDDALREFVPKAFTEYVSFPIRSVIYEKNGAGNNPSLFIERNVGFNHKREISKTFAENEYISDLKWNVDQQAMFKCRVEAYCYEILWMLRNHSLTHGGTEQIQVAVTYPLAMRPVQLRIIKDAWRNAWKGLIDPNSDISERNFMIESVAPYKYSVVTNHNLNRIDAYVNIDIGGGSTDILYYKEGEFGRITKSRAYSVFFAANDLWGNGIAQANRTLKDNGFILNLEKKLDQVKNNELRAYKGVARNSSDVITYLFSKPAEYHFTDSIRQSSIASVVVVHFASIIYYLAKIIETDNLEVPACINFTGMGSKYIDIIAGSQEELSNIVKVIFNYVGVDFGNIIISQDTNPKEVTALGAAYMLDPWSTHVETPKTQTIYCVDGEADMERALTYADTLTEETWNLTRKEIEKFIELIKSDDFNFVIGQAGLMFSFEALRENGFELNTFKSSYITMTDKIRDNMSERERNAHLKDSPFFWALKDTLYNVALRMARNGN